MSSYKLKKKSYPYWCLFYDKEGFNISEEKLMGRQAAGWSFMKALIQSKTPTLGVATKNSEQRNNFKEDAKKILIKNQNLDIKWTPYHQPYLSEPFGGIFMPGPGFDEFVKIRSFFGHDRYSLIGITHTTASKRIMQSIQSLVTLPVMPWDALICTSQSVLDTVTNIIDNRVNFLKERYGYKNRILPKLPVIPLGIDENEFNYSDSDRVTSRKELNIDEDDIVVIFVGRLSFHAKAHHFPMYKALEECSKGLKDDQKIHLIQTGWFNNNYIEDAFIDEAKEICPSVKCHFLDGRDQRNKKITLSAGDLFMSLSDNIQETFGITPIEAMASGIPVIVSDWNGYKDTVRNNVDGFKIPTITLPKGYGEDLAFEHMINKINYDTYLASTSLLTAIDIQVLINKLLLLINDKDLRKRFGTEGKKRAKSEFSWKFILDRYELLANELDEIRLKESKKFSDLSRPKLPSEALDPFDIFSSYPTTSINDKILITKTNLYNKEEIDKIYNLKSVKLEIPKLNTVNNLELIYKEFENNKECTISDIEKIIDIEKDELYSCVLWLLKFGFLSVKE